jgi:galactose mutarotase-like enzyme
MSIVSIQKVNNICHISTLGAQILDCKITGKHIFRKSHNRRRSGVPILFPFAGSLKNDKFEGKDFPQHGFARDLKWKIIEHEANYIVFKLETKDLTDEMRAMYPYKFEMFVKYELKDKAIVMKLKVISCEGDIKIAPGIHPYFPVYKIRTRLESRTEVGSAKSVSYDYKNFRLGIDDDNVLKITDSQATKIVHWSDDPQYTCWEPWTRDFDGINNDPIIIHEHKAWKWQIRFKVDGG